MIKRYFLRLSYLGSSYSGWQIQPNAITVQEVLQENLTKLNRNVSVKIMGCGRTDAGVHAKNFYTHMDFPEILDIAHFLFKLNHMLPHDIAVHAVGEVAANSHTRYDATLRTYKYYFHFNKNPFLEDRSVLINPLINIDLMKKACEILQNYRDFEAFSRVKTDVTNFICDLTTAEFNKEGSRLVFTISANRFLRNMVRAIVGTLTALGEGKIDLVEFENIIKSKDRTKAGKSAPAKGLFLTEIKYPYLVP